MVFTLTAILISSIAVTPAFAQMQDPIVISTDKPSYSDGETVIVSGQVRELLSGYAITLQVIAPNGNKVTFAQLDVGVDKMFSTELTAGGPLWRSSGEYTIMVLYGTDARTAETTFEFGGSTGGPGGPGGPTIDVLGTLVSYTITGGTLDAIEEDFDSKSLIISITATDDGNLTIILPRNVINAIFEGVDDEFFVLVDDEEVDFDEIETTDTHRTLSIDFNAGSEQIEIIGTFVIPEFGAIAALILAVAIISIIAVSAKTRLSLIPRY